jgi:hypothetical protein
MNRYSKKDRFNHMDKPLSLRHGSHNRILESRRTFGKTHIFYKCDSCGTSFNGRFCTRCGLEAKDWKKYHTIGDS